MCKLHLTEEHEIIDALGKEITLTLPTYNISNERMIKQNGFFKCHICKDYFDQVSEFGKFHPKFDEKTYCKTCFQTLPGSNS